MESTKGLRFLFVTGKGGTGKSTIAAALGLRAAAEGRKTLVVAPSGTARLGGLFGLEVSTRPTRVAQNLFVASIDAEGAMREYVEALLSSRLLTDALFHQKFSRGFLHGIPGLRSWALLGKAWFYSQRDRSGPALPEAPFDTVVLDAPSTGDSTDLLRVPSVVSDLMPVGPFRKDADDCAAFLRDPRSTRVVAVTLPEDLPVTESLEIVRVVRDDLRLPLAPLVVNQLRPNLFTDSLRERLKNFNTRGESADERVRSTFRAAHGRAVLEGEQALQMARLEALGLPLVRVPRLETPPEDVAGLGAIVDALEPL